MDTTKQGASQIKPLGPTANNTSTSTPEVKKTTVVVKEDWIEVIDGKFTCSECENTEVPETNSAEGIIKADAEQIIEDLKQFPTKIIYGICPVCGMEYVFKLANGKLYMEPSDMEK